MGFIGGDTFELTYNHPTIGSGVFFVKAEEDSSMDGGGFRKEDEASGIAGNGQAVYKITRGRWSYECQVLWDKTKTPSELDVLKLLAADPVEAQFTMEFFDNTIWGGSGSVVGDVVGSTMDATIPIKLAGGGELTKQA